MRAYWKGYLRLSLVTIGVELYSAMSSTSGLSLHQIHKHSGKRIRYQKVAPGIGPVDTNEIVKGLEIDKDEYVLLDDEELDAIKLESKRTIELLQFVDYCEIDPRYYEKPYYVVPAGDDVAVEGFTVIREALRRAKKVGLGQMAVRGHDNLVAIKPCGDGLLLETLRYANEVRGSDKIFSDIPEISVDKDMLDLASELIERKSAAFEPESFKSQYAKALRDLVEEKRKTGDVASASDDNLKSGGQNVIDLMEALKKSVAQGKKSASKRSAPKKPAAKRGTGKRAAG